MEPEPSVTANRELRRLVETGLTEQHSTRRWAHYTLSLPAEMQVASVVQTEEGMILRYVREHGSISNSDCRDLLNTEMNRASYLLKKMHYPATHLILAIGSSHETDAHRHHQFSLL